MSARPFIVKVQASLHTSERHKQVLIYDERQRAVGHGFFFQGAMPEDLGKLLAGRAKAFFRAQLKDGLLEIIEEAPWQQW